MVVSVGIIGATGVVGQRYIQLIEKHPFFEIEVVTASDRSVGKSYRDAVNWELDTPMPKDISKFEVKPTDAKSIPEEVEILFSALPSKIASKAEPELCKEGYIIASNSSNERMSEDVPLFIPEINADACFACKLQFISFFINLDPDDKIKFSTKLFFQNSSLSSSISQFTSNV